MPYNNHLSERSMINTENNFEQKAAVTIQKHMRGYLCRLALYNSLCQEVNWMPKASGGHTAVYLPGKFSRIVLKQAGAGKAKVRLLQMRRARTILEEQNSRHLEIPLATLCGPNKEFLAETRLKIVIDNNHNWQLYLTNPQKFDNAVREMVRLFSKVFIRGITTDDPRGSLQIPVPRFDNFPLSAEGVISLIDLENIDFTPKKNALLDLAAFFPLHVELIKEEGAQLGMDYNDSGRLEKREGMIALAKSHMAHQVLNLTEERREELTKKIESTLMSLNLPDWKRNIYREQVSAGREYASPEFQQYVRELAAAKEVAPKICAMLIDKIKACIREHPNQTENISPLLLTHLGLENFVPCYVEFKRAKLYEDFADFLRDDPLMQQMGWSEQDNLPWELGHATIPGMLNGREIFYYDSQPWTLIDGNCRIYFNGESHDKLL